MVTLSETFFQLHAERYDNRLRVKVKGSGSAKMMIDLRYNRPAADDEICPFHITEVEVHKAKELPKDNKIPHDLNCDVCGNCDYPDQDLPAFDTSAKPEQQKESTQSQSMNSNTCVRFSVKSKTKEGHGMSIVNFGIETDVEVLQEDLKKLMQDNPNIVRYELPSSGSSFILFYLDQIKPVETNFIFRLKDNNEGNVNRIMPSYVKVYDYYNPDQHCTKIYVNEQNKNEGISYKCTDDRGYCQCEQNTCVKDVVDEILRLDDPSLTLLNYTCNPEKANYAVLVTIGDVNYDERNMEITATGIVETSIHKGIQHITSGDQMIFFWKQHCHQMELFKGKKYYIIGKDGHMYKNNNEFRYLLMGTALVIEHNDDKTTLGNVMNNYVKLMSNNRICQLI